MGKDLIATHVYTDQVVYVGACYLKQLVISSAASQTTDCYVYDNATAVSGTLAYAIDPSAQGVFTVNIPEPGMLLKQGLAIDKGANHAVTIVYQPI
jgi:hypothetical protein